MVDGIQKRDEFFLSDFLEFLRKKNFMDPLKGMEDFRNKKKKKKKGKKNPSTVFAFMKTVLAVPSIRGGFINENKAEIKKPISTGAGT